MATGLTMLFVLVMVVAMAWDAATLEIPDTASIVLAAGFLGGAIVRDAGLSLILQHMAAGLALFAVGAGLFRLGVWGGGDVKFMAATGLWFGWGGLPAGCSWWRWPGACLPSPSSSCVTPSRPPPRGGPAG